MEERDTPGPGSKAQIDKYKPEVGLISIDLPPTRQTHGTSATLLHGYATQNLGSIKNTNGPSSEKRSDFYPDITPKTCSRCQHLVKNGINIHSTLAYRRCRCHRIFQCRLLQHQLQSSRTNGVIKGGTQSNSETKKYFDAKGTAVTGTKLSSKGLSANEKWHSDMKVTPATCTSMSSKVLCASERQYSDVKVTPATCTNLSSKVLPTNDSKKPVLQSLPKVLQLPPITKQSLSSGMSLRSQNNTSPRASKVVHQLSPDHSTSRLPNLSCSPVHFKEKQSSSSKLTPSPLQAPSYIHSSVSMNHLADMIHYILPVKKQQLKIMFKVLDKDEDGHLSCAEFLGSLPFAETSGNIHAILTELYKAMSDATYFGQREFIVSCCIAEVLTDSTNRMITQSSVELNKAFIHDVLTPYMSLLSVHVVNGRVFSEDLKVVVSKMNADRSLPFSVSIIANRLAKVFQGNTLHFVDCIALAPFYLNTCRTF